MLQTYIQWAEQVVLELELLLEITTSDAQAMMDANRFYLSQCWGKDLDAAETAKVLQIKTAVTQRINQKKTP